MLKKGGFKPALLLNLMEAVRQCNVETLEREEPKYGTEERRKALPNHW